MRRLIAFAAEGQELLGTLDVPTGGVTARSGGVTARTGVLIVSGGNEPRMGAHRGMAMLAAELAAAGVAVFRFDRRGVGDSAGENGGFLASRPDIRRAALAFADEVPGMARIVGFGNCDAASALALFGRAAGIDAVVLANPWLRAEADALPPAAAIRARYAARLRDPATWRRLARGGIDLRKFAAGLAKLGRRPTADDLAVRIMTEIAGWADDAVVVLAAGDATAIAFGDAAGARFRTRTIDTASHSFAGTAGAALRDILLEATRRG